MKFTYLPLLVITFVNTLACLGEFYTFTSIWCYLVERKDSDEIIVMNYENYNTFFIRELLTWSKLMCPKMFLMNISRF